MSVDGELAWYETHLHYVRIAELNAVVGRLEAVESAHAMVGRLGAMEVAHASLSEAYASVVTERDALAGRLLAVQRSTSWKVTWPLRQGLMRFPRLARLLRQGASVVWWAGTFQLHTQFGHWLRNRRATIGEEHAPAAEQAATIMREAIPAARAWRAPAGADRYQSWLAFNQVTIRSERELRRRLEEADGLPRFSVVMPVYEPDLEFLRRAVGSVLAQVYAGWELCIADDASSDPAVGRYLQELTADPRIKVVMRPENGHISAATNSAAELAGNEFIVLLDHDDEFAPEALAELALYVAEYAETDLIYSDSDKIDVEGQRSAPHFKPDFSPEMLLSYMYAGQILCVRRSVWQRLGGMRVGFEGSQDHDFALRAGEVARHVGHVARVLYHWRSLAGSTARSGAAKPYSFEAGRRAIQDALVRRGSQGIAHHPEWAQRIGNGIFGVAFPDRGPQVTVVLQRATEALRDTHYQNYDVLVLEQGETVDDAVRRAAGDYVVLLRDNLEMLNPGWLSSLVGYAQLESVGAVGGLLRYADGRVRHAGFVQMHPALNGAEAEGAGYLAMTKYARNVSAVSGEYLLVSREHYLAAGGFDGDIGFCDRLADRGLRHIYVPDAEFRHTDEVAAVVSNARARRDPYLNPNLCGQPGQFILQPWVAPTRQMAALRVVFCSHNLNLEGAPQALFEICTHLKRTGQIEPLVYSPREGSLRREYEREGVKVIVAPSPLDGGGEYQAGLRAMGQVFVDWAADVVVANTLQSFYAIDAARELDIPSVWQIHESDGWRGYYDDLSPEIERRALACFGHPYRVVFVALATRRIYEELDYNHNATVISGGIDAVALTAGVGRAQARARLRIEPTTIVLLTVGTVGERKGQLDAVAAFERLDADVMLLIVGDVSGPYSFSLHGRVEAMPPSMRARIIIVAERDDIATYYAAADIFVFCSRMESYPRVIMEAMAFGLPIVTTAVNGIAEQVQDGVNARFYRPGEIADLTRHLGELIADADLRAAFGARSRARLETLNSAVDVAEAHGSVLREAVLSSVPPSRAMEFEC